MAANTNQPGIFELEVTVEPGNRSIAHPAQTGVLKALPLLVIVSFQFGDGLTQYITTKRPSQGLPLSYSLNYPLGEVSGHGGFVLSEGHAIRSRE